MIDRIDSILDRDRSTGVQTISWSHHAADRIRSLGRSQLIVLLTPVVPQPRVGRLLSEPERPTMASRCDPFECLGQTICTYTKKLNHVPYLPSAGMAPLARQMIPRAEAIVVVNAEPEAVDDDAIAASVARQRDFATAVAIETVQDARAMANEPPLPLVMLHCGTRVNARAGQLRAAYSDYDIILHVKDYAFTALVEAGHALMGEVA